jgi:hypothetical protein
MDEMDDSGQQGRSLGEMRAPGPEDPAAAMVISLFTSPGTAAPMTRHESIEAVAGVGLAGDRYATGKGFYSGVSEWDAHVTLIAMEPFVDLAEMHGVQIEPEVLRRNIVTRGVDLNALIGREFRIGEQAVFRGRKAWPPCSHIVKLSGRTEIFQYLAKQTGIGVVGGPWVMRVNHGWTRMNTDGFLRVATWVGVGLPWSAPIVMRFGESGSFARSSLRGRSPGVEWPFDRKGEWRTIRRLKQRHS